MKAMITTAPGGIENLQLQEINKPSPGAGEVLIKLKALSVNPVDIKTRQGGALYSKLEEKPPVILGWDVSGVVEEIGNGVTQWKAGDEVFGMINFPGAGKAYAEYVTAPQDHLARKPKSITHEEAVATTLAALTAYQVLVHEAGIKKGDHFLMHAAAGGVGHFAVQLAKHFGARVSGTASAANLSFLRSLGVDNPIDYQAGSLEDLVSDVDIVFDPMGGETTAQSIKVLKPGGKLFSIVGGVKDTLADDIKAKNLHAKNYMVHSSGADMKVLAGLLEHGAIKPIIENRFVFEDISKAHAQIETGRTRGKVVVTL